MRSRGRSTATAWRIRSLSERTTTSNWLLWQVGKSLSLRRASIIHQLIAAHSSAADIAWTMSRGIAFSNYYYLSPLPRPQAS